MGDALHALKYRNSPLQSNIIRIRSHFLMSTISTFETIEKYLADNPPHSLPISTQTHIQTQRDRHVYASIRTSICHNSTTQRRGTAHSFVNARTCSCSNISRNCVTAKPDRVSTVASLTLRSRSSFTSLADPSILLAPSLACISSHRRNSRRMEAITEFNC